MSEEQRAPQTPPEEGTPPADPTAELKVRLAAAEEQAAKNRDSHLRAAAELDNLRKRTQRDLENAHKYGLERFLSDLLPVKDSLEMALATSATQTDAVSFKEGVDMTLKLLAMVLERYGVKEVAPARGEGFNPELHEAMAAQESNEAPADSVLTTVQKGYVLNGRLLRPARVLVAKPLLAKDGSDTD
jgi:molecular chaperone GrpE